MFRFALGSLTGTTAGAVTTLLGGSAVMAAGGGIALACTVWFHRAFLDLLIDALDDTP